MVRTLIGWAVHNPLVVILFALALAAGGGFAFYHVNVEAYPDPAPAIIEVVAQYPGASAEEVERQITVPLEVALAGMPGLQYTRSKSLFGLAHLRNQFDYSRDYEQAKQDVINRLAMVTLPGGVTPQISPASPTGEILRFTLSNPRDPFGRPVYTLNDLKALQDYVVQRELLRVPRVAGVSSSGGTIKRYEVHPDPDRLRRFGVSMQQLQNALSASNGNAGGDNLTQGQTNLVVRAIGLYAGGQDPFPQVLGMTDPVRAASFLRAEEARRAREIRQTVVASVNNVPVRVDHLVDGGPLLNADGSARVSDHALVHKGVVIAHQTRQGKVSLSRPRHDERGRELCKGDGSVDWQDEDEKVQGIVLLRKGYESLPALRDVKAKIEELNEPGHLLPGVKIETYYDRTQLIGLTTETVRENLLVGMALVAVILLMFLSNVRVALIVALNVPLALLFAFGVLFARGRSANLLSIGAVDFGIIVDSTVILVETIYRYLGAGGAGPPGPEPGADESESHARRILRACGEVERSLLFSTIIMVCALLPLFTMKGPEGQIFGPMADTYAFALGGALLLAVTVSPVLCYLFLRKVKPRPDNWLVRGLKAAYLWQLRQALRVRWLALAGFLGLLAVTGAVAWQMGREFMPELEEGNIYLRGTFPINISFDEVSARSREVRRRLRGYPEVEAITAMVGRPDDGTDPTGYYNLEIFVPLRPAKDWPAPPGRDRPRTKEELIREMDGDLKDHFPGIDWDFSQYIRDNVMEALSGVKGENSVKIFGPDLARLEDLAEKVRTTLKGVEGVDNPGVFRIQGQSNLEFPVDRQKCARWNVSVADVQNVIQAAVGGKALTQVVEGGRSFDLTVRFPWELRRDEQAILNIPVDLTGHQVVPNASPSTPASPVASGVSGLSPTGTSLPPPALTGSATGTPVSAGAVPRRRLADFVTPLDERGRPSAYGSFLRPGASTIYREQGQRLIAVKFGVRGRDLAGTVAEARAKVAPLMAPPYRTEWSGEFQEMEEAEARMARWFALSLVLIVVLLYLAFHSLLDAAVVFANVLAMGVGGVWALRLTGLNFNISAAVGFISILGVAVMNGLLFVSAYNRLRAAGLPLGEALVQGTGNLVRPVTMTALAALLGLLPAALSTRIGSQSQRPLAIVVVGGMLATLVLMNVVPVLYSFYGKRQPPAGVGHMGH